MVPGAAFLSMPLCLLSRNLPWPPNTPLGDRSSGLRNLWTCFSSLRSLGPLGLLHMLSAFPPLSLSLLHLTTWKVLFHLAKSCSSFKLFHRASGSKSFANTPATQGLLPVTSELIHISFTQVFAIILFVCMHVHVSVCACSCMCRHVYVFTLLCVHAHRYAGICICMRRSEDNSDVIFINTVFL